MKKKLRPIALWLMAALFLWAKNDFDYHIEISDPTPFLKEAVLLTLDLRQTNTTEVLRFSFEPPSNEAFRSILLRNETITDKNEHTRLRYVYALFPLRTGPIEAPLTLTIERATEEALMSSLTGSSDNAIFLKTQSTTIAIGMLKLTVRPLPAGTELVGDYKLEFSMETNQTTPDGQIDLRYTLEGRGYEPEIEEILPNIPDVVRFREKEVFEDRLFHKIVYRYALISSHDFTLPAVNIKAYDPQKHRGYTLKTSPLPIRVSSAIRDDSIRPSNLAKRPKPWEYRRYMDGFLLFCAGFATALLFGTRKRKSTDLKKAIARTKTPKELLSLLLSSNNKRMSAPIERLEEHLYRKKTVPFSKIKKEALERATKDSFASDNF